MYNSKSPNSVPDLKVWSRELNKDDINWSIVLNKAWNDLTKYVFEKSGVNLSGIVIPGSAKQL